MTKTKTISRYISLILTLFLVFSLFSGCTPSSESGTNSATININEVSGEIFVGEKLSLVAIASNSLQITWVSSDEEVAVVQDGTVTGIAPGQALIIATCGVAQAICTVTVKSKPAKPDTPTVPEKVTITLNKTTAEVEVDSEILLTATASNGEAVTWLTSNADKATVTDGVVKGISAGKVNIVAQVGDVIAICSVTVKAKPQEQITITLNKTTAEVEVGSQITLTATSSNGEAVTWKSSDTKIATVTGGRVKGVKAGTATITASIGEAVATCTVTVKAKSTPDTVTITISKTTAEVEVDGEITLTATASNGTAVAWKSSDEGVATVANGKVKGIKAGTATITAYIGEVKATCEVTVKAKPATPPTITISKTTAEVEVGSQIVLTATASNNATITWTTSDASIATVANGTVRGVKAGTATITASVGDVKKTCTVTVKAKSQPAPTITISKTTATIEVDGTVTLTATASNNAAITWLTADASIATVTDGKVKGIKAGTVIITAKAGTLTAICTVTVRAKSNIAPNMPNPDGYTLVWNDEFNGNSLDRTKWDYQVGTRDVSGNGPEYWGNNELQYYTEGDNLTFLDGSMIITAKREQRGDRPFTSARIVTRNKAYWTFGYMEARMQTPAQLGMWPAFWMLPQPHESNNYGTWAANGEIDIMEARGREPNKVDTTIHFGGQWPQNTYKSKSTTLSSSTEEWHTYGVEWTEDYLAWIVDGVVVYRLNNNEWWTSSSQVASAPFDRPFYILLNLAVGGSYDGNRQPEASFTSADMFVDYVRVFQNNA